MNYLCEAYKVQLGKRIKCDEILSNCNFKRRKCSQVISNNSYYFVLFK